MEVGVGCMRYFGVKSYLNNFYNRQGHGEQNDNLQYKYLIPSHRQKFSSRWWKFILWFGSFLVFFGLFLLLIGFLLPRKKINVDSDLSTINSQVIIIDRKALSYNTNLDINNLLGICLVATGGVLFTLSLLIPTFCHMWCASGDLNDETDPFQLSMDVSSSEQVIPIQNILKPVQPNYRKNESRLTTEGIVPLASS